MSGKHSKAKRATFTGIGALVHLAAKPHTKGVIRGWDLRQPSTPTFYVVERRKK